MGKLDVAEPALEFKDSIPRPPSYPRAALGILVVGLFESFGSFGTRTMFNQYLKTAFGLPAPEAKALVHFFNGTTYLFAILGAALSDSYFGTYKTIIYFYLLYIIGIGSLAVFSINGLISEMGSYPLWCYLIPGLLTAAGSGGIKPCIPSLAGHQFSRSQKSLIDQFFSYHFMIVAFGSIITLYSLPYIKDTIYCFGGECYCLSFLLATISIFVSLLVFLYFNYRVVPPEGKFLPWQAIRATMIAIKSRYNATPQVRQQTSNLLNFASNSYSMEFLQEIRQFGQVATMFLPLIFVWMLDEQSGTEWQNQYELMNKTILGIYIPTESCANINLILVCLFVPLVSTSFFPWLEKRIYFPAQYRIVLGYFLIIIAFVMAAMLNYSVLSHSNGAVYQNGIVIECTDCINGLWQLPQFSVLSLGQAVLFPSCTLFSYQQVGPLMRSCSAALFFLSMAFGNISVLSMELPLQAIKDPTLRLWVYLIVAVLGLIWYIFLLIFWFKPKQSETPSSSQYRANTNSPKSPPLIVKKFILESDSELDIDIKPSH